MAKKEKVKKEKKNKKARKPSFLKEVVSEMKKVSFPTGSEVVKYTFATVVIVVFLALFFLGLTALLSWVKGVI